MGCMKKPGAPKREIPKSTSFASTKPSAVETQGTLLGSTFSPSTFNPNFSVSLDPLSAATRRTDDEASRSAAPFSEAGSGQSDRRETIFSRASTMLTSQYSAIDCTSHLDDFEDQIERQEGTALDKTLRNFCYLVSTNQGRAINNSKEDIDPKERSRYLTHISGMFTAATEGAIAGLPDLDNSAAYLDAAESYLDGKGSISSAAGGWRSYAPSLSTAACGTVAVGAAVYGMSCAYESVFGDR